MNKLIIFSVILGCAILFSCKKDETRAIFDSKGNFTAPVVVSPAANAEIVITENNQSNTVTFKWKRANYNLDLGVTYNLMVDSAGQKSLALGSTNDDSLSMTYGDLNTKLLGKKYTENIKIPLTVTVISVLDNQKDSLSSQTIVLNVTTYKKIAPPKEVTFSYLYIAGDFQGWNITKADSIASVKSDGVYEGYIYISNGGSYKLYSQLGNWNSQSYGDSGAGNTGALIVANYAGANFVPDGNGYYEIGVDLNKMTWTQIKTTWSVIGDATDGGWNTDTPMTFDPTKKVWTVTLNLKTNGSFKFRANNDWKIDFGVNDKGKLTYADNTFLGNATGINNITVAEDGKYTLTLDLSIPGAYSYTAVKN